MEDTIGRSLVIDINKFFPCSRGGKRAAGNTIHFSAIVLLICLCGPSPIIYNPCLGTSFSVKIRMNPELLRS